MKFVPKLRYLFGRKKLYCCLLAFLLISFSACVSTKDVTYFQPASKDVDEIIAKVEAEYTPKIQSGDILSIIVSSLDQKANEMFNPIQQPTAAQNTNTMAQPVIGFKVDETGNISLPLLGSIFVKGLTSDELAILLTQKLQQYLESPTVIVRIANYTVTVLGEVARPNVYMIPNEKITLPQALALAGDINIYGKRKNVLIIREIEGNREFVRVDLTNRNVFNSPYYYLHSGDVVYVEPSAGKITSSDRLYQLTPIVLSSLTFLVMVYSAFIK